MMKTTVINIIFILIFGISQAQTEDVKLMKNWQLKGYAESAERYNDSFTALKFYSEYYRRNPQDNKTAYKTANLYFETKDFEHAKPIFYSLYKKDSKAYPKSVFKYGQILKNEKKFDSAAVCFRIYRDELIWYDKKSEKNLNLLKVERELKGCEKIEFSKNKKQHNVNISLLNSTINSAYKDASPVILNDSSFVYTSYMIDSMPVVKINTEQNIPSEKFYFATLKDQKWEGGKIPPKPFFNLKNKSVSGGVFSDDGKRFYFSAGYQDIYGKIYSSLYVCKKQNNEWTEPEPLDNRINLKNYMSTQPAIGNCYNVNFDVIYFVSDRPGGIGGSDIWYTIYDKVTGEYKTPVNAGSFVNSPGNEITPRTDNSMKILYFSSDSHSGYGGYDIYKTFGELVNWTRPENMGEPFNSAFDDFWFTRFQNDSTGFLVSNRNDEKINQYEHCLYNIFEYGIINKKTIVLSDTIFETDEKYYDKFTQNKSNANEIKKGSSNTVVKLHIKNNENGEYICLASDTTDTEGKFKFKVDKNQDYMLTVEKQNYTPTSVMFTTDKTVKSKLKINPVVIIPEHKKAVKLNRIYFEFDKWTITTASKQYLDTFLYKILVQNPDIVIEIDAHTDGIGDSDYNLELSKNRAESVVKYLTSKGIEKSRLIAKGYGEENPIAAEFMKTGEDDPEGRAKNRRIEFRVVGQIINNNIK